MLKPYFTKLLEQVIGQDDRTQILRLLTKPWNPNVFRHTTATEFAGVLSDADAKPWFGWADNSDMPSNYRNYYGDEASKRLMISFGLEPQSQKALPKYRECPNVTCKELNIHDAPFCAKCRVPLTVSGFMELDRQKDQDMYELKEQMNKMGRKTQVVERQLDSMEYWILKLIQNPVQPGGAYPAAVTEAIWEANRQEEPIRVREGRGTEKEINELLASPKINR